MPRCVLQVLRCFEAGAVATGCTWEWRPTEHPYAPLLHDDTLADLWDRNFEARGRVIRDGSDLPRLGRAEKIDKLARAFGVEPV